MVCFVHDRRRLSQFHGIVNQLRRTKQFTTDILRQVPNRCCSCPGKRQTMVDTEMQPLLTTLDFDALQHLCIILDLKQCLKTYGSSSSSHISNYTILPFPTLFPSKKQMMVANQFINEYNDQPSREQLRHDVDVEFVTSNASQELLNDVIQRQYDLVTKSLNYSEAKQIVNSLWVVFSAKHQLHIDLMKVILQQRWVRFLENIEQFSTCSVDREEVSHPLVTINTWCKLKRARTGLHKVLSKRQTKYRRNPAVFRPVVPISRKIRPFTGYVDDDDEHVIEDESMSSSDNDDDEYLIEDVLRSSPARLQFLSNRFDNSSKPKQPRTHRRQHLLALVLAA